MVGVDGTGQQPVATYAISGSWSPDLSRVAVVRSDGGWSTIRDIWLVDADGVSNLTRATFENNFTTASSCERLAWSPDGTRIAASRNVGGFVHLELVDLTTDPATVTRLVTATGVVDVRNPTVTAQHADEPDWHPSGDKILFRSHGSVGWEIWSIDPDGTDLHKVKDLGSYGFSPSPRWHPDGDRFIYNTGNIDSPINVTDVTLDATGHYWEEGGTTTVGTGGVAASWGPDGRYAYWNGSTNTIRVATEDGSSDDAVLTPGGQVCSWYSLPDVTAPTDPTLGSTSHTISTWSSDTTVDVTFSGASDDLSGVDGFSYLWDTSPSTVPDTVKDAEETAAGTTSPSLANGTSHYFHLRTRDNAGNWTSTVHLGPFWIVNTTPGRIVSWVYNTVNNQTPGSPPSGDNYVAIAAGYYHNLALNGDGTIVRWGNNYGQPPAGTGFVAIAAGTYHGLALRSDGSIAGWGGAYGSEAPPPAGTDYVAIAAGGAHSLALRADGSIVGWGFNAIGQAAPPGGNDYVAIAAGTQHSLALRADGSIAGWGYPGPATPPGGNDYVAIAANYQYSLALRADGTIEGWGDNGYGTITPPPGNNYVAIAAGQYHSLALSTDTSAPIDPTLSSSHTTGVASDDPTVEITWSGASDPGSGVDGFSYEWNTSPTTVPDTTKDAEEGATATTSAPLPDGDGHWFHLSTRDNAGNWTSTVHMGPFAIDTAAPAVTLEPVSSPTNDSTPSFGGIGGLLSGDEGTVTLKIWQGPDTSGTLLHTYSGIALDGSGNWSKTVPDPDALGYGTHTARAFQSDSAGNTGESVTRTFTVVSSATISGDLSCNSVNGNGFASNSSVSVVLKDGPGGTTVYSNPTVPTDGTGNFNLFCGFGPDLVPGMEITVSDGPTTKVLLLADLTIDAVDPATDVVSGTAPANASVFVGVSNPPSGGAALTTTADGTGAWSVDFTGTFDITGGTHANASVSDADGDRTFVNKLPATISGDLSCNSVNGNGFAPNSSVSVTVKDAPGGTTVYDNPTVPTDGTGNFNLFCGFGPDLTPGMEITVSGGSDTKVLVLADLAIDSVDPATDVVSGTAPANSSVFVGVNNPPGPEGAGQNTTADGTGAWSVDFTGTFDITGGTHANASVADGDGDNTFVNKPPATINGDITNDGIGGGGFDPNATVTIEVRDSPGGSLLVTATVLGDGQGNFNLCCGAEVGLPDLVPGMEITASQGATTKVLVLVNITIDSVDPATDVVSGTAPANSSVFVGVNNPPGPGGAGQNTTADGSGNWTVDFTGTFDITAGTNANASVSDADGDTTNFNRQAPSINGNISDDFIGGEGFEPSATVTVEVRDAPGGTLVFTGTSPTDGGGGFGLCCGPEVGLPDLVPGMEITVSDGSSTKVLVLAAISIDALDPATDEVSGTAPANSSMFVGVNNSSGEAGLNTTADGSGNWSVDFTGTFDIDLTTQAQAHVFDDDGDATSAQERPPTIHASYCCLGNINGEDFTPNASVTLEIFDSPGGTLLLSQVVPTDRFGFFELNLEITGVSLSPGMQVVATDDTTSDGKELTLEPLTFDALNPSADTASGTAQPGTTVLVEIFADPGASLEVVADGSGSWVADFGAIAFDVTSAMGAIARVPDADGDTTDDEVFTPTISGSVLSDFVSGSDFTPNASVDVQIFDSPGGALLFSGSVATGGEFGDFGVGFEIHGVDLVPGTHIVVTDGVTTATKELTLVSMSFDVLDPVTDTASGTAPPNATVVLEVFDSGGEFFKETVADGAGRWTVDLGAEGFDVIQGGGNATVRDDDGDGTVADRGVPTFSATLTTDEVSGYSFTNSSIVTVEIFDSPGGALLFSGSAPVGSDSTFSLGSGTHGVDLAPGMHITVMDDTTSITKQLTLVLVTFDVLDPVDDVASGTAPPGMPLGLQFPEGGGETAPADENGDWFADLGAGGGDITPDVSATICAVDGDGDCTAAEYVPEADLLLLKTDPPGRQPTGRNMTYTLTVSNVGPKAAYEATATDVLPSSVTFVSATPTQGSCGHSGGTVTCNLGTIASGATVTIAIVVRPTVAGTIVNTASVGASTPDPNNNNNVDAENTSICRITSRRSSIPCG